MCLRALTESQKVQINMFLVQKKVPAGELLWGAGVAPSFCFVLFTGECLLQTPTGYRRKKTKVKPGNMVGDFPALLGDRECQSELSTATDSEIFVIKREDLLLFLGKNPGMVLVFKDEYIVE